MGLIIAKLNYDIISCHTIIQRVTVTLFFVCTVKPTSTVSFFVVITIDRKDWYKIWSQRELH